MEIQKLLWENLETTTNDNVAFFDKINELVENANTECAYKSRMDMETGMRMAQQAIKFLARESKEDVITGELIESIDIVEQCKQRLNLKEYGYK